MYSYKLYLANLRVVATQQSKSEIRSRAGVGRAGRHKGIVGTGLVSDRTPESSDVKENSTEATQIISEHSYVEQGAEPSSAAGHQDVTTPRRGRRKHPPRRKSVERTPVISDDITS